MRRGINANIQSMSQAEKTLLRYQYVIENTTAAQGDFLATSNTWANQVRVLRENLRALGSIVGEVLINAFKPFVKSLNQILGAVKGFVRDVANALGAIFGWTIEIGGAGGIAEDFDTMADAADDTAAGLGKATKKAKELKNTILSFDELNVLNGITDSNGGSGSGSGGSGDDALGLGGAVATLKRVDSLSSKYESEIKNLTELGQFFANSIKKALGGIDWDGYYAKMEGFGRGLAQFLNGFNDPEMFNTVGRTIGNGFNGIIRAIDSFLTTFNSRRFGESIATLIKGIADSLDAQKIEEAGRNAGKALAGVLNGLTDEDAFTSAGSKLSSLVNGFVNIVNGFASDFDVESSARAITSFLTSSLEGINWTGSGGVVETVGVVGRKFAEFLNGLFTEKNAASLGRSLGGLIQSGIQIALSFVGSVDWRGWGQSIAAFINNALGQIKPEDIFRTFSEGLAGLGTTLGAAIANINWTEVLDALLAGLSGIMDGLIRGIINLIKEVAPTLGNALEGLLVGDEIANSFSSDSGSKVSEGLVSGIADSINNVSGDKRIENAAKNTGQTVGKDSASVFIESYEDAQKLMTQEADPFGFWLFDAVFSNTTTGKKYKEWEENFKQNIRDSFARIFANSSFSESEAGINHGGGGKSFGEAITKSLSMDSAIKEWEEKTKSSFNTAIGNENKGIIGSVHGGFGKSFAPTVSKGIKIDNEVAAWGTNTGKGFTKAVGSTGNSGSILGGLATALSAIPQMAKGKIDLSKTVSAWGTETGKSFSAQVGNANSANSIVGKVASGLNTMPATVKSKINLTPTIQSWGANTKAVFSTAIGSSASSSSIIGNVTSKMGTMPAAVGTKIALTPTIQKWSSTTKTSFNTAVGSSASSSSIVGTVATKMGALPAAVGTKISLTPTINTWKTNTSKTFGTAIGSSSVTGSLIGSIATKMSTLPAAVQGKISLQGTAYSWRESSKKSFTSAITGSGNYSIVSSAASQFSGLPNKIFSSIGTMSGQTSTWASNVKSNFSRQITGNYGIVGSAAVGFSGLPGRISSEISVFDWISRWASNMSDRMKSNIRDIPDMITRQFNGMYDSFWYIGDNIATGLWNGINYNYNWVLRNVAGFASSVINSVKSVLGIASPSKVFKEIGAFTIQGFEVGLENEYGNVYSSMMAFNSRLAGMQIATPQLNTSTWAPLRGLENASIGVGFDMGSLQDAVITGVQIALDSANERPINVYATLKTENDEVLARAVNRGQRSIDYRMNPTAEY